MRQSTSPFKGEHLRVHRCFRASALVSMLRHSTAPTAAYPTMAAVEALAAVVCEPGARTTDPILRHALLSEIGALGRPLFALFNHPASTPCPAASHTTADVQSWQSEQLNRSALNTQDLVNYSRGILQLS